MRSSQLLLLGIYAPFLGAAAVIGQRSVAEASTRPKAVFAHYMVLPQSSSLLF